MTTSDKMGTTILSRRVLSTCLGVNKITNID